MQDSVGPCPKSGFPKQRCKDSLPGGVSVQLCSQVLNLFNTPL